MNRIYFLPFILLLILSVVDGREKPNVLFIAVDDLRPRDHELRKGSHGDSAPRSTCKERNSI